MADVVVVGAGGAGLPAALAARRAGADVICLDENHDVGGHAILSGGRLPLGGGTSCSANRIEDSPDRIYQDFTGPSPSSMPWLGGLRLADRELVRAWAEACAPTYEFLVEHGVPIDTRAPTTVVMANRMANRREPRRDSSCRRWTTSSTSLSRSRGTAGPG